jgi:glutaredoxin-like protein NrdH
LDKGKIDYSIVDLSTDEGAYEMIKSLGYQQAPVVIAGDEHWSGFRPDMISKLSVA